MEVDVCSLHQRDVKRSVVQLNVHINNLSHDPAVLARMSKPAAYCSMQAITIMSSLSIDFDMDF